MTTNKKDQVCSKDPDCPYWGSNGCTASITEVELGCGKKDQEKETLTILYNRLFTKFCENQVCSNCKLRNPNNSCDLTILADFVPGVK